MNSKQATVVALEWRRTDELRPHEHTQLPPLSALACAALEADIGKRRQLVWEVERKLAEERARPVIFFTRVATCRQPHLKGLTLMVNSLYNANRREDWWLDK